MVPSLPNAAGIGYKPQFHDDLLGSPSGVHFVEVHAENYLGAGGTPHRRLRELTERFPLSVHGVGLSLGGVDRPDARHLSRVKGLLERYPVASFSEHLAWSAHGGSWVPDLLPVAYDQPTLDRIVSHVNEVQEVLGRSILVENPSTYLKFEGTYSESQFLTELAGRTGCGLLLDVNNLFVSAQNHDLDANGWIDSVPASLVGEIHVAGHASNEVSKGREVRIDDHSSAPNSAVWNLLRRFLRRAGPRPVLLEWDNEIPEWTVLRRQIDRIQSEGSRALTEQLMARIQYS